MPFCGYLTGDLTDPGRSNWSNDGPRPIKWSAWYPTEQAGTARMLSIFEMGPLQAGAPLAGSAPLPVVLMSHGTGGVAEGQGYLARALALAGHVVLAANHHGNTGAEPYRPEGFLCWWERPRDLTVLLDQLSQAGPFAGRLDLSEVGAVGFSLGGYTVLSLAGAITSAARFEAWRNTEAPTMRGPREAPDAGAQVAQLLEASEPFRQSWHRDGQDYTDLRVKRVVAIAPAPTVRGFDPATVARIETPVTLLTGGADAEAPNWMASDWLRALNPSFAHLEIGADVGHYTFLGQPAPGASAKAPAIFQDPPGVDRAAVHARTVTAVAAALARTTG